MSATVAVALPSFVTAPLRVLDLGRMMAHAMPVVCLFRTPCPYAIALCGERGPQGEPAADGRWVACQRFRKLPGAMLHLT
jgi:hypothetical protein